MSEIRITPGHFRLRAGKRRREEYRRLIEGGAVVLCARCRRRILPGTPFDLGHTADRTGWTGAEHSRCNRVGARNGAVVTNAGRRSDEPDEFLNPSRDW